MSSQHFGKNKNSGFSPKHFRDLFAHSEVRVCVCVSVLVSDWEATCIISSTGLFRWGYDMDAARHTCNANKSYKHWLSCDKSKSSLTRNPLGGVIDIIYIFQKMHIILGMVCSCIAQRQSVSCVCVDIEIGFFDDISLEQFVGYPDERMRAKVTGVSSCYLHFDWLIRILIKTRVKYW